MPTQSIDLSATTTLANFNGSPVEQINLNGTGIWTKPPSNFYSSISLYNYSGHTSNISLAQSTIDTAGSQMPLGYLSMILKNNNLHWNAPPNISAGTYITLSGASISDFAVNATNVPNIYYSYASLYTPAVYGWMKANTNATIDATYELTPTSSGFANENVIIQLPVTSATDQYGNTTWTRSYRKLIVQNNTITTMAGSENGQITTPFTLAQMQSNYKQTFTRSLTFNSNGQLSGGDTATIPAGQSVWSSSHKYVNGSYYISQVNLVAGGWFKVMDINS